MSSFIIQHQEIDENTAPVVRKIFQLCIEGLGPAQIAKKLTAENILTPTSYKNYASRSTNTTSLYRWSCETVKDLLSRAEYAGHTVNFKTSKKSYKSKKKIENPPEQWQIFRNTHEAIVSQEDFDLVQEIRANKRRRLTKHDEVSPFSGMVYCADCGQRLYLARARTMSQDYEHMKCSTYAFDLSACSVHYIRTSVLTEILLSELNKICLLVKEREDEFLKIAAEHSTQRISSDLKAAKKKLAQTDKRIAELDRLFVRLYEDNVAGKISDERFSLMSANYEAEQKELKKLSEDLNTAIQETEQQTADTEQFIKAVRKYTEIKELTPEIMHELIEKIVVHAPDKSSGKRTQQIDIYYRFNVAVSSTTVTKGKRKTA